MADKLAHIGIRGSLHSWFKSYVTGRVQYVQIGDSVSPYSAVSMGVPQGSILGPILFLIYINDMSSSSSILNFVHFADDTTVTISRDRRVDLERDVNSEMEKVYSWLCVNRLSLNIAKTCYMVVSDRFDSNISDIYVAGNAINRVNECKFLGVVIDKNLSFMPHVDALCKKISRSIGLLGRLSNVLPFSAKKSMYFALIYSSVSYGIVAWGRSRQTSAVRVERLLRRARRYLLCSCTYTSDSVSRLLNFESMFKYFTALKMYQVLNNGQQDSYYREIYDDLTPAHQHETRFSTQSKYNIPAYVKSKCQNSYRFQSIQIWNILPNEIKFETIGRFKFKLKSYLADNQ